ncbi:MAG: hypothetical protein RLY43_982 [Bacteroidota bacterium]|jgi:hypothetical protein
MENISVIEVSAGNFLRIQCMEYSSIDVLKDQIFQTGQKVIIECKNDLISSYNKVKLVREVIDFDSIELVSGKKALYNIILRNENFGTV